MNFKLRGVNHILSQYDGIWNSAFERTMVVGADVTHSAKGSESNYPSLAGVVATYHIRNGHFLASARLQSNNTEVSTFLSIFELNWY